MKVGMGGLTAAVEEALETYGREVVEGTRRVVRATAEQCRREIREKSPRRTQKYAKGWRIKETAQSSGLVEETVYNAAAPQLTHLLEDGHAKVNGGRVEGKAHIRPPVQRAEINLVSGLEEVVRR